ncbi:MAG TPA: hypothetical protein VFL27_12820 [Candidatus Dormibacteraeota bacterium]|nr:hypothetical protein [Candidatus Dormibacteraeota bacterium]
MQTTAKPADPRINRTDKPPLPRIARVTAGLEVLVGVGAMFGGGALVLGPDGHLLSMPTSILAGSPFHDYLIPGLILFSVIGVGPIVAAALTLLRASIAPYAAIASGAALIGWIAIEMVMLVNWGSLAWSFYLLLGASIVGAGLWWRSTTWQPLHSANRHEAHHSNYHSARRDDLMAH